MSKKSPKKYFFDGIIFLFLAIIALIMAFMIFSGLFPQAYASDLFAGITLFIISMISLGFSIKYFYSYGYISGAKEVAKNLKINLLNPNYRNKILNPEYLKKLEKELQD